MGQRYLLRVEGSGVWLDCELLPPAMPGMLTWRGRRAHRWTGAVDCSALAQVGPGRDSRITVETTVSTPDARLIEAHPMSDAAVEAARRVPVAQPS